MQLSELKSLHVGQLLEMAIANEIEGANRLRKQELVFALLKNRAKKGEPIFGEGVLEAGFGSKFNDRDALTQHLASAAHGGQLALTFEIIYGHAFKPTPRVAVSGHSAVSLQDMRAMLRSARPPQEPV